MQRAHAEYYIDRFLLDRWRKCGRFWLSSAAAQTERVRERERKKEREREIERERETQKQERQGERKRERERAAHRQATEVLPELICNVRCLLHSSQRSLENSIKSDSRANELLHALVLRFSGKKEGEHGSLARTLKNSGPLKQQFYDSIADLASLAQLTEKLEPSVNFAFQRFDTVCKIFCTLARYIGPVKLFLSRVVARKTNSSAWAAELLEAVSA